MDRMCDVTSLDHRNLGSKVSKRAATAGGILYAASLLISAGGSAIGAAPPEDSRVAAATAPSDSVDRALTYAPDDRAILGMVQDGDRAFEGSALYILLRQAKEMPSPREVLQRADRPNPDNLWRDPGSYRGKLIALKAHYAGVTEERRAEANRWFGDRTYWLVHTKVPGAREAVILALAEKPPDLRMGQLVEFAGAFYKTVTWQTRTPATDGRNSRTYPIVVVKTIVEAETFTFPERHGGIGDAIAAVVGTAVIFIAVHYYLRRRRHQSSLPLGAGGGSAPAEDAQVDPELCRAVEEMQSHNALPTAGELSGDVGPGPPEQSAKT